MNGTYVIIILKFIIWIFTINILGGCKILKPMRSTRPQRQVAVQHRLSQLETNDHSDEFNSNSENESDLSNRRRTSSSSRPQRECKSRTKTLVAISLAEQDYDKFDLGNKKNYF